MAFTLASDFFGNGEPIPKRYTCDGEDQLPALHWSDPPSNTQSFAIIVDDPDAPGRVFTHWIIFNLPADERRIVSAPDRERLDNGAAQGQNDFGRYGYGGPCPPPGKPHHYHFTLYALDTQLNLNPGVEKTQVIDAMRGHILDQAKLIGTYKRTE